MTEFTPVASTVGGILIGLGVSALLLANGRVAGVSGIMGRALALERAGRDWRWAFLAGLPLGAWLCSRLIEGPELRLDASLPVLVVGGVLVGLGTQLGSGCTSGHGICGLARGSRRSALATGIFTAVAALVVFVLRHVAGA